MIKFGKKEAKKDARNFLMKDLLLAEKVPEAYNFDNVHRGIPVPMFGNDQYGDCVIAGRGHQTLRFEHIEQKKIIPITDVDVLREWRKENGNTDDGLYILDSLNLWRKDGWLAAGKNYKIKAFAQINPQNLPEVKTTIYNDIGIMTGFALPDTCLTEFDRHKYWINTKEEPNPYNGHCVFIVGYSKKYITCLTWARRQKMSYAFFQKYCDEAYGIIDATNVKNIDEKKLDLLLGKA